ncbi:MAG: glycosyltransferase family 2 protein [Rhodoferax sp.]
MPPPQRLAVVVTTYNRSDALLMVLQGLALQDDAHFSVVVADDGSRPQHCEALHSSVVAQRLGVLHMWQPDVGFTASCARNRGVAAVADADYLVFLDGDCVPEVDFVRRHRQLAQRGALLNGSRVMLSEALTQELLQQGQCPAGRSAGFWWRQRWRGDASKLTGLLRLPDGPYRMREGFSWKGIRSCNMGVWREDFERVNGFDESFVGWGHEDADFVLRLHHAGVRRKNGFCATEVYHLWHQEFSRAQESQNAATVRERVLSGQVRATKGYSDKGWGPEVVLTRLG